MDTLLAIKNMLGVEVPADAVKFNSSAAAVVTSATPVVIKAATAAKYTYITEVRIVNITAAEVPIIQIKDDADTPILLSTIYVGDPAVLAAAGIGTVVQKYNPPLKTTIGEGVTAQALATVGDCWVECSGFVSAESL